MRRTPQVFLDTATLWSIFAQGLVELAIGEQRKKCLV